MAASAARRWVISAPVSSRISRRPRQTDGMPPQADQNARGGGQFGGSDSRQRGQGTPRFAADGRIWGWPSNSGGRAQADLGRSSEIVMNMATSSRRRGTGEVWGGPVPDTRARHWPGRTRAGVAAGTGLYRRDHVVRADDDGQRRVGCQGPQAGGRCVAGETDVDPVGVLPGARSAGVPVPDVRLIRTRTRPCRRQNSASRASGRRAVSTAGRPARTASSRTGGPSPADTSGLGIRPPAAARAECRTAGGAAGTAAGRRP